jgi:hypothetical protein
VKRLLSFLFIPQEKNNHRAAILSPGVLGIFIAVYLLNQSLIKSLTIARPGVLGYSSEITITKVFDQTNVQRQKYHLGALKYNKTLSESAKKKAQDMFANNYWSHNSPKGKVPWDFFHEAGYDYSVAGENLAKDFYDTESLMRAWMNSPTHKENIISSKYQEIGVAVVDGVLNGVKTTLVVQHFGTPLNPVLSETTSSPPPEPAVASAQDVAKAPVVSPLALSKTLGLLMFIVIIGALFIDGYVTLQKQTHRLTGSSVSHIGFLAVIILVMLFTQQGSVF